MTLSTMSKAIGGAIAGLIVSYLMKHNVVISDTLPDALELVIASGITFLVVYFSPKNKTIK